jgi:hypothetical protein
MRNLVQGKYGERTTMGIGYSKAKEFHMREIFGRKMVAMDY